jgi:fructose-1,6-bisphosphatase/inositol monophosphatase family enzyme
MIASGLLDLLPGSRVVGEEACAANPSLLDGIGEGTVWLVDPIDGTANFVAGRAPFAMMIALLKEGETVASWIFDPLDDRMFVAQRGGGAWKDGERILAAAAPPVLTDLRGIVSTAFCPADGLAFVERARGAVAEVLPTARCAGHEYPLVAMGYRDFILYWRTLAWDHAPGALLLTEAGGSATYLDGTPYSPASSRTGLLLTHHAAITLLLLDPKQIVAR